MNPKKQISILYQCAEYGFEDVPTLEKFLARGVGIDIGSPDFETPFACDVRNCYFKLAAFLCKRGANPNALYRMGLMDSSTRPSTVLARLANENSQGSLSCLTFLLNKSIHTSANLPAVSLIVEPSRNHTVFHTLAILPRDT
jgi:ankyrin repeat protein